MEKTLKSFPDLDTDPYAGYPLCISMYVKQHQLMIIHTREENQTGAI